MAQRNTTRQNLKSGKGVAKQIDPQSFSKFSATYWQSKVFRPRYTRDGSQKEVPQWYARIQSDGRREAVGLGTNNKETAGREAARLYQAIRTKGWNNALVEFKPDAHQPQCILKVGDYIEAVKPLATARKRSFACYCYALRKIALEVVGVRDHTASRFHPKKLTLREAANKVPLSCITGQAIEKWKFKFIAESSGSPVSEQRARRNVNSFIRNARALFSKRILKRLRDLKVQLPHPLPFEGVELEKEGNKKYRSTVDAAKLIETAKQELAETEPEVWKVILLALGAGLRRGEIDGLCRSQIDFKACEIWIENHAAFEAKTTDSQDKIFVDPGLLEELRPLMDPASLFVVDPKIASKPHKGQYYRCDETFNKATDWLRKNGVMSDKPLHTLRKEFGSIIAAKSDIHTASRQLRHANISTTAAFYADHRRRAAVEIGVMLGKKPAAQ